MNEIQRKKEFKYIFVFFLYKIRYTHTMIKQKHKTNFYFYFLYNIRPFFSIFLILFRNSNRLKTSFFCQYYYNFFFSHNNFNKRKINLFMCSILSVSFFLFFCIHQYRSSFEKIVHLILYAADRQTKLTFLRIRLALLLSMDHALVQGFLNRKKIRNQKLSLGI